ncbi:hypothetical protein B0J17DRAFT_686335 [Rhizoctonia solani]|nr:hypothetical protein B0J17DRAFT_686335 [Rhizoctonia solani]
MDLIYFLLLLVHMLTQIVTFVALCCRFQRPPHSSPCKTGNFKKAIKSATDLETRFDGVSTLRQIHVKTHVLLREGQTNPLE